MTWRELLILTSPTKSLYLTNLSDFLINLSNFIMSRSLYHVTYFIYPVQDQFTVHFLCYMLAGLDILANYRHLQVVSVCVLVCKHIIFKTVTMVVFSFFSVLVYICVSVLVCWCVQREKYLRISVAELPGKFSSSGKFCGNWQKMAAKGCHLKKSIWKI